MRIVFFFCFMQNYVWWEIRALVAILCLCLSLGHFELFLFFWGGGAHWLVRDVKRLFFFFLLESIFCSLFSWLVLVSEKGFASELGRVFLFDFCATQMRHFAGDFCVLFLL
uniref:(northern house mosquito) hypothetical protein n=1 Tax=Culex pipiens TaxID=7175 RepID=A0A8D8MVD7_CULPI